MLKTYILYEILETNNMFQLKYVSEIQKHNIVEAEFYFENQGMESGKEYQITVQKG